jgi:DNA-binding Lrp family transcriptional regulator
VRLVGSPSLELAWRRYPGRTFAENVRSAKALEPTEQGSMKAYVLVTVRPGKVRDIVQQVENLSGVKTANACWGLPDIFVVAEVENADELNKLVIGKIQSLEGVERTETHIAIE